MGEHTVMLPDEAAGTEPLQHPDSPVHGGTGSAGDPVADPDVLVVGGGPAGSTVAGLLAGRGWRVTILDRAAFPRPEPCGECINPGGVAALRRLGLLDAVLVLDPVPLVGWDVVTDGGRPGGPGDGTIRAEGRFGHAVGPALAVARSRLDHALLERARSLGVTVEEGVSVAGATPGREGRLPSVTLRRGSGRSLRRRARVVVGADGLRSVVARSLGAPHRPPRHRKLSLTLRLGGDGPPTDRGRLVLTDRGTVGLAPVGPDSWNATVVVDAASEGRRVATDPTAFALGRVRELVPDWNVPPEVAGGPWTSGNFDFRVDTVVRGGVVLVGDAAGYYDPLTGQGIYRALRSAELAAASIDRALRGGRLSNGPLEEYARRIRAECAPGRRVQRAIEAVIARPPLRRLVVGRLASAGATMDALVRVTGDARPAAGLLRPSVWAPAVLRRRPAASPDGGPELPDGNGSRPARRPDPESPVPGPACEPSTKP